ncbi:MAG: pyrroline-5-carboxylate reductase [Candidatus Thioglobus sp.]|nr:MAG: pyrroline-5-carboxylate reductase [Candidatus Thioglobus sp.]
MQKQTVIGFIGAGNMAFALISGLLAGKFLAQNIKISDLDKPLLKQRKAEFGVETFSNNAKLVRQCDVVILAVKPQILPTICQELREHITHKPLIISIAAGIKSSSIAGWLAGDLSIVRAMPNTPALLGMGATGMIANAACTAKQKKLTEQIIGSVGLCFWVENEEMMDAVTALSGSGPAYLFLLIESMANTAVALGLDEEIARKLSVQTALGASMMASKSDDSAAQLRAKVTSKNGTTQAAIESFQEQDFELIVSRAMRAAADRAREIGAEFDSNE